MTGELFHVGFIYVLTISISVEINGKQINKSIKQSINSMWCRSWQLVSCGQSQNFPQAVSAHPSHYVGTVTMD